MHPTNRHKTPRTFNATRIAEEIWWIVCPPNATAHLRANHIRANAQHSQSFLEPLSEPTAQLRPEKRAGRGTGGDRNGVQHNVVLLRTRWADCHTLVRCRVEYVT